MLDIQKVRYEIDQGRHILNLVVNGKPVWLNRDHKPDALANDVVLLGHGFESIALESWQGEGLLEGKALGIVKDEKLAAIYRRFLEASNSGNFIPGEKS